MTVLIPTQSQVNNPVSGAFGTGQMQIFANNGTWTVPQGIGKARVRVWGAGGGWCNVSSYYGGGGGGGFAMKVIYGFEGVTSVPVTVGVGGGYFNGGTPVVTAAGTSSFGSYVSATGGSYGGSTSTANIGGTGVGGDVNNVGGTGSFWGGSSGGGGGGVASIFGNGGNGGSSGYSPGQNAFGGAGGGAGSSSYSYGNFGGNGFLGLGSLPGNTTYLYQLPAQTGFNQFSIDFIGTGGGGSPYQNAANGGGAGGYGSSAGWPGGGAGYYGVTTNAANTIYGASGLVIVEY